MFQITGTLNRAHFLQMELLEKQFYSEEYITPADVSYAYYLRFPRSTFAALDGNTVIGFINLFPVTDAVYQSIRKGDFNDSALTADDIADIDAPGSAQPHFFLSCIAVSRAYRKQGVTAALLRTAARAYESGLKRGDFVVTDNVTAEGCRFSERLGFQFVCRSGHDSDVYALPCAAFAERACKL